jgi:hypothetical protein
MIYGYLLKGLAVLVSLAAATAGVVHFVRSYLAGKAAEVDDEVTRAHVAAMEAAEADARAKRESEFDGKVAAVRTPADAAALLHSVSGDDPRTN